MIIRLSTTLAKKIKETNPKPLPVDPDPFADWAARLFTANRAQYILITNTASLYSVVIYGKGITHAEAFIDRMMDMLRDVTEKDGLGPLYENYIAPQAESISFSKATNRSVIGSVNDIVYQAKLHLTTEEISPYAVSFRLNELPMSYLKYRNPREAFESIRPSLHLVSD